MNTIEPCCAPKQLMHLRDALGNHGKAQFQGYGDLSLTEFLPALLTRYSETEMMIVAPSIPDQAYDIIREWLRKTWARMDGKGRLNVLSKLTIIADLSEKASPKASAWLTENPFADRLVVVNREQSDTALLVPDIAITGPLNFQYGTHFVCDVTTIPDEVSALWKEYTKLTQSTTAKRSRRSARKSAKSEPTTPNTPNEEDEA